MERPQNYFGKFIVIFFSISMLIFLSGAIRRLIETSINSQDFSRWLSALPDFISSSLILSVPSIIPVFLIFLLLEKFSASKYLKISTYAISLMFLPLIVFAWGIVPKGHNLQASNNFCKTYIDGSLTLCGFLTNALALIGSVLVVAAIVSIKNLIFIKGES